MNNFKEIKKRLVIKIDESKHTEIKLAAYERGMTMTEFVEKALYKYGEFLQREENEDV